MRGEATVRIGGKERKLILRIRAISMFEQETGKSALETMQALGNNPKATTISTIVSMLWCGLSAADASITKEQVEAWIDDASDSDDGLYDMLSPMIRAFMEGVPLPKKAKAAIAAAESAPKKKTAKAKAT